MYRPTGIIGRTGNVTQSDLTTALGIESILLYVGKAWCNQYVTVQAIQAVHYRTDGTIREGIRFGGNPSGAIQIFKIPKNDYLTHVEWGVWDDISWFVFRTHKNIRAEYGHVEIINSTPSDHKFNYTAPPNKFIGGFQGICGDRIHGIGFLYSIVDFDIANKEINALNISRKEPDTH
jgi:hypothetical protein